MSKIAARAAEYAPAEWRAAVERHPSLRRRWRLVQRGLGAAERLIPPDRYFELYLKAEQADLLLVTPLVDFNSYQADYIKAAHRLGVPAVFVPFSWDNLTNRGLICEAPDRVLVWNAHQQQEAVALHGMPEERVVITGAPRFDAFMALTPSSERTAFCASIALDPGRPFLLYTCSSKFVAPREVEFVRSWISALRHSPDPLVQGCGVLVRPHPAHKEQWTDDALAGLPGVALWGEKGEMNADQGLYDSLYHAAAIAGLNTSAMIEAAIVGRAVFIVSAPEFAGGQAETMHFSYLLAEHGGPAVAAESLPEHVAQIADGLRDTAGTVERSRRFVASFVRPRGLDRPATDVVVEELEQIAASGKKRRRTPLWHYPARTGLFAILERLRRS
jgi:hypothetical protein